MKHHSTQSRSSFLVAPAFTLVEMLVVIAIISVMLTVGTLGLKNLSKASGVSAGLPIAEALFAEARAIAVGKGTKTRVLVHGENNQDDEFHRERFLRYMAIQYLDTKGTEEDTDDEWKIASRGSSLPKGVYFVKRLSESPSITLETVSAMLPGKSMTSCYYYEFNAEGLITSPQPNGNEVPRFVVLAGSLPPGTEEPIATGGAKKNMGGFVIWRSGRSSLFRHPDQIENSN